MRPKRGVMRNQDSLDLLGRQDRVLEQLFEAWRSDDPEGQRTGERRSKPIWQRGTVAKLVLEQGALRIAALEDVVRNLRLCHQGELAENAGASIPAAKLCLDRIDECSRGVTALDLRYSSTMKESIEELRNLWIEDMQRKDAALPAIAQTLGPERKRLRSALYIRAHAPPPSICASALVPQDSTDGANPRPLRLAPKFSRRRKRELGRHGFEQAGRQRRPDRCVKERPSRRRHRISPACQLSR